MRFDPKLTWYVARASGLVAWALVTASIVWGLALSTRLVRRRGVPAWLLDLHRYLGTLSLVFVAVHIVALWADSYVHFAWRELFVPMASPWRPGAVAWGIVATYLLVAVEVTSWAIRRLSRRVWHAVHLSSLALFLAATWHGFAAGADASQTAVRWGAATGSAFVVALVVRRLAHRDPRVPRRANLAT
jgi:Ferric reductase like transmembrane component